MPALSADAIIQETTMLKRRYDDITSECQATRKKLELALERSNGFISTSDLDVDKDDLAKEVAALENEMEEVEYGIEVANHATSPAMALSAPSELARHCERDTSFEG